MTVKSNASLTFNQVSERYRTIYDVSPQIVQTFNQLLEKNKANTEKYSQVSVNT